MKNFLKTLCLLGIYTLIFSCSGDAAKSNVANAKSNDSSKMEVKKAASDSKSLATAKATKERFPRLRMLPSNPKSTDYAIGTIGGVKINRKTVQPITASGDKLVITGWAIDKPSNQVPGDLFIDIDGQKFGVAQGKSPMYLKKMFDNPALHTAGFRANIPMSKLSKGKHELKLYVIAADKKSFYTPRESYEILIK